jgi:hypothetical protein
LDDFPVHPLEPDSFAGDRRGVESYVSSIKEVGLWPFWGVAHHFKPEGIGQRPILCFTHCLATRSQHKVVGGSCKVREPA